MMELCSTCTACLNTCPTGAIQKDRFLIQAEQCLTFFNEKGGAFPDWIDPAWHNCLIGCMICQDTCPANKDHTAWIIEGEEFSEEETLLILEGASKDTLPRLTIDKLKRLYMSDDYDLLQRNLGVLMNKSSNNEKMA